MSAPGRLSMRAHRAAGVPIPLAVVLALACGIALACAVGMTFAPRPALAQEDASLMDRISNEKMQAFEDRLTKSLDKEMSRYISPRQFVLAVKVVWNPNLVPVIRNPQLSPKQQKLPGFPIFVRAPDSPATEDNTPPFQRLEVKVLIDETLPDYYERFVRKLIPIVARMDFSRGDQVVVLKETFPVLPRGEQPPPTLPEKELMHHLGETKPPGQKPPAQPVSGKPAASEAYSPEAAVSPAQAAQEAYSEGRYQDALRIVEGAFQSATGDRERGYYLGLEGSILYTQGDVQGAKAAWERSVTYDPTNVDVHKVLNYLTSQESGAQVVSPPPAATPQEGAQP